MVQLPIPIGPDAALPIPIQHPTIIFGDSSSGLGGMWQILPDGSFVPTAANVSGDISSPNGYDLAGVPAVVNLGGAFRLQGPDGQTGFSVFGGGGDTRTAIYGQPILFLTRDASNQFLVMNPTDLVPFGAAVGTYNLGESTARFGHIYATSVDVSGAFTVNGVPITPGTGGPITWAMITGTPTTIAGYGITDAFTMTQSDARYAAIADGLHGQWTVDGTGRLLPTAANTTGNLTALTFNATTYNPATSAAAYFIVGAPILARDNVDMNGAGVTSGTNCITDISGRIFIRVYRDPNTVGFVTDQIIFSGRSVAPAIDYLTVTSLAMLPMGAAIGAWNIGSSSARIGTVFATTIDAPTVTATTLSGSLNWSFVTNRPTTLAGYGITDAASSSGPFAWANITGKPTTIAGYGITDAFTQAAADARYAPIAGPFPWGGVTGTPTTLAGYGITDAYTKAQSDARFAPIGSGGGTLTHWQDSSAGPFLPLASNTAPDLGSSTARIRNIFATALDLTGNLTLSGSTSTILLNGVPTWPWFENVGPPPYVYLEAPGETPPTFAIRVNAATSVGGDGTVTVFGTKIVFAQPGGTPVLTTTTTPPGSVSLIPNLAAFNLGGAGGNAFGSLYLSTAIHWDAGTASFFQGTTPNITGSRGGNAALASLLTTLASMGLITDGSTA